MPVTTGTLGAAAGVAGGVLLSRIIGKQPRKVLGIKLPGQDGNFSDVARAIKDAGKQMGKLAGEVRAARRQPHAVIFDDDL